MLGIHRLIPVLILQLVSDIRRQRHLPQLVQNFLENAFVGKLNQPVSLLHHIHDRPLQKTVTKGNHRPRLRLLPRFHQRFPDIMLLSLEQQYLDLRFRILLHTKQPGRNHLRVIDDKAVPFLQIGGNIPKPFMLDLPRILVQHKQPGRRPVLQRVLRNQFLRQIKIKIRNVHDVSFS